MDIQRISLPPAELPADNNIRHQYPIHRGKWVRHPSVDAERPSFCRFTLEFALDAEAVLDLHVSADNRFELRCDGEYVGMGPDRGDLEHWSFHTYRLKLDGGSHRLTADVHYLGLGPTLRPWAQTCIEPGFVLYCDNSPRDVNTGSAPWRVALLAGVTAERVEMKQFFVVGPAYRIDARGYFCDREAVEPVVVREAGRNIQSGTILPGWKLYPSRMPEQVRRPVGGGRVRFAADLADLDPCPAEGSASADDWQKLIEGRAPVTVPAGARVVALWDLEQYHTAYPELTTTGGDGAWVRIEWAESCFDIPELDRGNDSRRKGHRGEVAGKYFRGFGDTFCPDGPTRTFTPFWWRAGRYVRITVQTGGQPLSIDRLRLIETRTPLENQSLFTSDDRELEPVIAIAARGIQMCAHETYMDCPYYEQMMYVGDTRLQMLTSYVMSGEDRLNQRSLEIFDWSRMETGFVLERCPSQPRQLSCTFAMIWVLMLRDHGWWRREPAFTRQRLKGMRCMIEEFKALPEVHAPLLPALPGWSFMDWVDGLSFVNHPGPKAGVSSVVNLLFLLALDAAAEIEEAFGQPHLASYNRQWARRLAGAIEDRFWDDGRGLFADDPGHSRYSEHAQCLALLSGRFPGREARCLGSLLTAEDLARVTVYFSFYLLEVYARFGRGDLILQKLDFWKEMAAMGMKTPLEMPEPSRSDCHAWSSHPLYHLHASVAGIRPASPGFASVEVRPLPGRLTQVRSRIPHPDGEVSLFMHLEGDTWQAEVGLPGDVTGTLHWKDTTHPLGGRTRLLLPR